VRAHAEMLNGWRGVGRYWLATFRSVGRSDPQTHPIEVAGQTDQLIERKPYGSTASSGRNAMWPRAILGPFH
jgi:hypothetical protein